MGETTEIGEAPSPEELAKYPLNDLGNALRLIRIAGGRIDMADVDKTHCTLLYLMGQGWIGYNGRHWDVKFGDALARKLTHQVHLKMNTPDVRAHLMKVHGVDQNKLRGFLDSLGDAGKSSAMLKQAESYLTVEIGDFDRHPMAINCMNGTVWLKADPDNPAGVKCQKKPHAPADRITRMAAVNYDAKAVAPLFEEVWKRSLREPGLQAFFRRAAGYSCTGHTYERAMFMCQGRGSDGKSTLLNAIRGALGGYGEVGKVESFLDDGQSNASGASPDIVKLSGDSRIVVLSEPKRGARLKEGFIKEWTGGEPVSTRQLNNKMFDFQPKGRLWWQCNALPIVKGDDDGIWNRTHILLFQHQVPVDEQDKQLPDKLTGEYAGILNWLIAGVGDWLTQGLNPPEIVRKAKEDYRKQSSPFGDWLNECCVFGEAAAGHKETSGALYQSYKDWVTEQGGDDKPMSLRAFGDALFQRQILHGPRMGDGKKTRAPIRLLASWERSKPAATDQAVHAPAAVGGETAYDDYSDIGAFD